MTLCGGQRRYPVEKIDPSLKVKEISVEVWKGLLHCFSLSKLCFGVCPNRIFLSTFNKITIVEETEKRSYSYSLSDNHDRKSPFVSVGWAPWVPSLYTSTILSTLSSLSTLSILSSLSLLSTLSIFSSLSLA